MMFIGFIYKTGHAIATLVFSIILLSAFKTPSFEYTIVVSNTQDFERLNEIVTVERTSLGEINGQLVPYVTNNKHKILISQEIDKDDDGVWDELLIEVSLKTHGTDTLHLRLEENADREPFAKLTNVRLSLRSDKDDPGAEINKEKRTRGFVQNIAKPFYQMEGPGIENNKVAFRAFFDKRNGKDVYGKIIESPVLEQIGVGESWHELRKWGMDILHTGNSLGAGGLAVKADDILFRLGDADTSGFQSLYEGALKASFTLQFKGWDVARDKQNGSETISVSKGGFYYSNNIDLVLKPGQNLISGIANFGSFTLVFKKHNDSFSSVSTYGNQAEGTGTKLGLAIMFPSEDFLGSVTTDTTSSIPNTSYVALKPSQNGKKTLYFFACWEKTDSRFATQTGFEKYLQTTAAELAHPMLVKVVTKNKPKPLWNDEILLLFWYPL